VTAEARDAGRRWISVALAVAIGLGFAARAWVALLPLDRLVATCLSDDAFYYFGIARNLAAGRGPTFDGVIPTNGFHPLYQFLLVPLYRLTADPVLPVRISLLFLAAVGAATALPIHGIVARATSPRAGLLAAIFWLGNPQAIRIGLSGVEAGLAVFLLALTAWHAVVLLAGPLDRTRPLAVLGLLAGLTVLARADMAVPLSLLGLGVAVRVLRRDGPLAGRLARLAAAAVPAALLVLPWLVWNRANFGGFVPESGRTLYYRAHTQFHDGAPYTLADAIGHSVVLVRRAANSWFLDLVGFRDPRSGVLLALILLVVILGARVVEKRAAFEPGRARGLPEFGIGLCLLWLFYAGVFWQTKSWYFLPAILGIALAFGVLLGAFDRVYLTAKTPAAGAAALAALAVFVVGGHLQRAADFLEREAQPWQRVYLLVGRDLAAGRLIEAAAPETLGAFNAGIVGYFAERRVVNLDGVVNGRVLAAMKERMFLEYLRREGVTRIVDHQDLIDEYAIWSAPDYPDHIRVLRRLAPSPFAGDIVIAAVDGAAAAGR
jgi:hypothetical protein